MIQACLHDWCWSSVDSGMRCGRASNRSLHARLALIRAQIDQPQAPKVAVICHPSTLHETHNLIHAAATYGA